MNSQRGLRRIRRYGSRALLVSFVLSLLTTGNTSAALTLLFLATLLAVLTVTAMLWWRLGARRWWVFGGADRAAQFDALYRDALSRAQTPGIQLVRVERVTQRARRGTKAIVSHSDGRPTQDAWFWYRRHIHRGDVLLVRSDTNYGPHTHSNRVLYVGTKWDSSHGVIAVLPRQAWRVVLT